MKYQNKNPCTTPIAPMVPSRTTRTLTAAVAGVFLVTGSCMAQVHPAQRQAAAPAPHSIPAPPPRNMPAPASAPQGTTRTVPNNPAVHPAQNQEHLAPWMDRHRELPLAQQQKALESEPGFRDLPAETQQRMRDRLTQLNNMQPEQRRRLLERNEAMANLTVPQRQQVRGAM